MKKIFWIAGEKSGDLHASYVMEQLNNSHPELMHSGIGGPRMEKFAFKPLFPFARFSVMGFAEVIKHLSFFLKVEKKIKTLFREDPPDLVVLVDYPGLNLRIARIAKKFNLPVLYYICPQFWAWKKKRLLDLATYTDHVAYILPFEGKFLKENKINSTYVGHPVAEEINIDLSKKEFAEKYGLDQSKKWLGFLPGSRDNEIKKMLPVYLNTMLKLADQKFQFLLSCSDSVSKTMFHDLIQKFSLENLTIIEQDNYCLMKYSDLVIVTSGTATLETAYLGTPFIIAYKAQKISFELGKRFIRINRIGLPNIILDKDLAPELIQESANAENITLHIKKILLDPERYQDFKKNLEQLHNLLGKNSAAKKTAEIIVDLLNDKKDEIKQKKSSKFSRKTLDPIIFFLEKYFGAFLILLLGITYRYKFKSPKPRDRVIYAFWHRNLLPLVYLRKFENAAVLISSSRDGQFIAGPLEALGFKTVRGSSTRGGSQALREMIRISKEHSLAITPDGPKGPGEKIKPGLISAAFLTKLPIVLTVVDIDKEKIFNSWDRFRFPLPFSRINVTYSKPIHINNKDNIDDKITELEREFKLMEFKNKIKRG